MRSRLIAMLSLTIMLSCQAKNPGPVSVEDTLKKTMQAFLYKAVNNDSSYVKYQIEKVIYYDDNTKYICNFTVHVKATNFDTTGVMKAHISKDFLKVDRLQ
jgi:hypothetical protein